MRLTTLVRLGAAVTALGFLAPIAASAALRGPAGGAGNFAKGVHLTAVGGNAIVSCPPGNSQYLYCVAPTATSPNTIEWECGLFPFVMSGGTAATKVKNGKPNKKFPVSLAPYSGSDIFWLNTYSVTKKPPKVKKGKVTLDYRIDYKCYTSSGTVSGYVLVGLV